MMLFMRTVSIKFARKIFEYRIPSALHHVNNNGCRPHGEEFLIMWRQVLSYLDLAADRLNAHRWPYLLGLGDTGERPIDVKSVHYVD